MDFMKILQKLTLEEKARLLVGESLWTTYGVDRLSIPSVMMCDGPHGLRKQVDDTVFSKGVGATCFPTASALACTFNRKMLFNVGSAIARECRKEGVHILLGPGINMKRSPLAGRNFEYFSEDPYLTSEMACGFIDGVQSMGVGTCLKHYIANEQEYQRMSSNSVVDERAMNEIYLYPFKSVVERSNPLSVMVSYNKVNGEYVCESEYLLKDVLYGQLGFDGFTISDWGAVNDRIKAVEAGLCLEMPSSGEYNVKKVMDAVGEGVISIEDVDFCVLRILMSIDQLDLERKSDEVDFEAHYQLAYQAASESIVLLKNDNEVLPLCKDENICMIGKLAKKPRIQGGGSSEVNSYFKSSPYNELITQLKAVRYVDGYDDKENNNKELLDEAIDAAQKSDKIILFLGFDEEKESEGFDKEDILLPDSQILLLKEMKKLNKKLILVLFGGSAIEVDDDGVDSVVMAYLSGDGMSKALSDILMGKTNPSGKLSETFPVSIKDTPAYGFFPGIGHSNYLESIYTGYRYYDMKNKDVKYCFGHGLSYTEFKYSNMKNQGMSISVDIENIGDMAGFEVVQLYVSNLNEKSNMPCKELKGFEKIWIEPNQKTTVCFTIDSSDLSYYSINEKKLIVENCSYRIGVGSSSRDIRQSTVVEYIDNNNDGFTLENHVYDLIKADVYEKIVKWAFEVYDLHYYPNDVLKEKDKNFLVNMVMDMPLSRIIPCSKGKITKEMILEELKNK